MFWRWPLNLGVSDIFYRDLAGVMDLRDECVLSRLVVSDSLRPHGL